MVLSETSAWKMVKMVYCCPFNCGSCYWAGQANLKLLFYLVVLVNVNFSSHEIREVLYVNFVSFEFMDIEI